MSDVELAEKGDAARDPVLLRLTAWNHHRDDEVGGVSSGRQRASSLARLVDGRHVDGFVGDVGSPTRLEPDRRQDVEQHAVDRFVQFV